VTSRPHRNHSPTGFHTTYTEYHLPNPHDSLSRNLDQEPNIAVSASPVLGTPNEVSLTNKDEAQAVAQERAMTSGFGKRQEYLFRAHGISGV
jgi:hypothetical protein